MTTQIQAIWPENRFPKERKPAEPWGHTALEIAEQWNTSKTRARNILEQMVEDGKAVRKTIRVQRVYRVLYKILEGSDG